MNAPSLLDQALTAYRAGDLRQAELRCRHILAKDERHPHAWALLAQLADHAKHPDEALRFAIKGVEIAPDDGYLHAVLGDIHQSRREYVKAISAYDEALRRNRVDAKALNNKSACLKAMGDMSAAIDAIEQAFRVAPQSEAIRSNLLTMLLYDHRIDGVEVVRRHREVGGAWTTLTATSYANDPNPDRRIRIGYVSPDLCEHAVMRFFESILKCHDRRRFEIVLYSECPIVDDVGRRLRSFGDHWRITWMKPAEEIARLIRDDRIDILVDLAGHTQHNRLDIMSLRPAPVQMTYLGYPSITGLKSIDYRLTDWVLDPEGSPTVEALLRLPGGYACFQPPANAPDVSPSPTQPIHGVTFGSHHPTLKLNADVFECWRRILEGSPFSRLVLFRSDFQGDARSRVEAMARRADLPADRLSIETVSSEPRDYLRAYEKIDIVLDCFPFTGHTMTCEAMWMGVPVLTLYGNRPSSRLSSSVLTVLGLESFIATSRDEYVQMGIEWSHRRTELADLRGRLRGIVAERLGGERWIGGLEALYRQAWSRWCAERSPSPSAPPAADSLVQQGLAQEQQGRAAEALAIYQEVNRLEPWNAENPFRLGNLYTSMNQLDEAEVQYRRTTALAPTFFPAWAMLGQTFHNQGRLADSEQAFRKALSIQPDPKAKVVLATLLPQIYGSVDEVDHYRQRVNALLEQLEGERVRVDPSQGPVPNFFLLAYQGGNVREIQTRFARLIEPPASLRVMPRPERRNDGRVRVGFLSEHFCNHTIGTLNRGFVEHLDRRKFHLTVVSSTPQRDDTVEHYRRCADEYVRLGPEIPPAIATLRSLKLDVLFFADLGMSCFTLALSALRFAPIQCVTWGHPLTTGLPTIDYFLSGSLYEVEEADDHYSEQLVRLPGLQTCYRFPETPPNVSRARFALPADAHWYGCPQTLFKMHPEFDEVLGGILRRDPKGILVLIDGKHPRWNQILLARWRRTMPDVVDRIHFLKSLPWLEFLLLCKACDVLLDPIHFGGGNTTLEGLAMGTPIVTWPTPFLRARLAQGMLRHAGLEELIVPSANEYISLATRLGAEPDFRRDVAHRIEARRESLFEHVGSIRAFEEFFLSKVDECH